MPQAYITHRRWISYRRYITRSCQRTDIIEKRQVSVETCRFSWLRRQDLNHTLLSLAVVCFTSVYNRRTTARKSSSLHLPLAAVVGFPFGTLGCRFNYKLNEKENGHRVVTVSLSMGYKKDIFGIIEYEFELLHKWYIAYAIWYTAYAAWYTCYASMI